MTGASRDKSGFREREGFTFAPCYRMARAGMTPNGRPSILPHRGSARQRCPLSGISGHRSLRTVSQLCANYGHPTIRNPNDIFSEQTRRVLLLRGDEMIASRPILCRTPNFVPRRWTGRALGEHPRSRRQHVIRVEFLLRFLNPVPHLGPKVSPPF